ncbi:MAG: pyrroline-5-carboxylate reductase [Nitrospirae bacterium]|nr:pyrroline-5-carboxylate reductase [Nitrospirota bacterium]
MIGFIGGGNMAEALIKGAVNSQQSAGRYYFISEPREDRRKYLEETYGIKTTLSNKEVADACNIIILAVKPQNMAGVLDEISSEITDEKTVVSIAAGITLSYLQSRLNTKKLVRVMPNTPALVLEGMSVISLCEGFSDSDIATVREIFMSVGRVTIMPEKHMNAVTAVSGSGPAFIALFIEGMIEAGLKLGLSKIHSEELAVQTLLGTARLLDSGMPAHKLREMVTSPGGTTAAGLAVFEERNLMPIVLDALTAARNRAAELGKKE